MAVKYSVIIPTYNRGAGLNGVLGSFLRQECAVSDFEVVVIDDGSRDNTGEVFKKFVIENNVKNFFYTRIEHGGPAKARNAGIKMSRGEIVFFTDDDCIPPPNWISVLVGAYRRHPEAVGVGGWHIGSADTLKRSSAARYMLYYGLDFARWGDALLHEEVCGTDPQSKAGTTANMSYRRSVLEELGGFDESIRFTGLEDWELKLRVLKQGKPLVYLPIFTIHNKSYNLVSFAKKSFLAGRGGRYLAKRHGKLYQPPFNMGSFWPYLVWFSRAGGLTFSFFYILQAAFYGLGWLYGIRKQ